MLKFTKTQISIYSLVVFCVALVFIRLTQKNPVFHRFLLWNLFLAYIPYFLSLVIRRLYIQQTSKYIFACIIVFWLIFFPNAPYIITDLSHLHHLEPSLLWYDLLLLFTFANTGLFFGIVSLYNVYSAIKEKWSIRTANFILIISVFLGGFGVSLGRFVRVNSWDMFTSPLMVMEKGIHHLYYSKTWIISLGLGFFMLLLFFIFKNLKETKTFV